MRKVVEGLLLPVHETQVQPLVRGDSMCHRAAKPATEAHAPRAHVPQPEQLMQREAHKPQQERPRWPQLEKAVHSQEDPAQPKIITVSENSK